jgi:hypothetical protein
MKTILILTLAACISTLTLAQPITHLRNDNSRFIVMGVASSDPEPQGIPEPALNSVSVSQNFPNPFHGTTRFYLTLEKPMQVSIDVFDITGQKVMSLNKGLLPAGQHLVSLDASLLNPGVYFYIVPEKDMITVKRMIIK